jgi:predicted small metal-binding protein
MSNVIHCPCGHVVEGGDDDELVANAQAHAREVHGMELTAEEALSMARPV